MLRLVEAASSLISLTNAGANDGRPRCLPRTATAFMPGPAHWAGCVNLILNANKSHAEVIDFFKSRQKVARGTANLSNFHTSTGRCRTHVKIGHKGIFSSHRIRFAISSTPSRLILSSIFYKFHMLRLDNVNSVSTSTIKRGASGGRPRYLPLTTSNVSSVVFVQFLR